MSRTLVTAALALVLLTPAPPRPEARAAGISAAPGRANPLDDVVAAGLARLGIEPAPLSPDDVFVRRAYLDVIGTLPTMQDVSSFIDDADPRKRAVLIERLLSRPEFADYWSMKWSDVLRVKSEFPINLWPNAVQAYHRWIRASLAQNLRYDAFARELLTSSGSNFRVPQVNFYRALQSREPKTIARTVALTFMGERAERWPDERQGQMAVFFSRIGFKPTSEWKEEIVYFDVGQPTSGTLPAVATFPDGTSVRLKPDADPREAFARWLTAPGNRWFARAAANRVWFWLMGRGVVHEPDDMRPDNPPSHPELLALLESELIAANFDLKHLYRLILNSQTYQRSSAGGSRSAGDDTFARYLIRPLDAEVIVDALDQITGTHETYASAIPEPYTFTPRAQRAIALADGSLTSPALEVFGRPARDTGLALERTSRPTAPSRLHLLNSAHVQAKLEQGPGLAALVAGPGDLQSMVTRLYLAILSRPPTPDERTRIAAYAEASGLNQRTVGIDVAWALINSAEFLYRH